MADSIGSRFKSAWNAFMNKEQTPMKYVYSNGSYYRPDRVRLSGGNERSIVTSVFNRIALDVAAIDIKHCRLDDENRYKEDIISDLNNCLTIEANIDQTSKAFIQDIVMSLFDEGSVAIVPVDTTSDPNKGTYDILSLRTGKITEWHPDWVKVSLYNDRNGKKEDISIAKSNVAIIENPFYSIMNESNSTLQRLMRKLVLLDTVDEQTSSGKLDLIIQLPYIVKSEARKRQANDRRKEIEDQLRGSKYGIAYTDGTEKITQLNRPLESNLMKQIEYLTSMLYSQLGITTTILDGTADENTMNNYYSRTIEPIVLAIVDEMKRKFLTKTARTQKQTIMYFRDPFKLVSASNMAEIADKFTRNEVLSSNEIRQIIGRKPSDDPRADMLINSNISQSGKMTKQLQNGSSEELPEKETEEDIEEQNDYEAELQAIEDRINEGNLSDEEIEEITQRLEEMRQ